MLACLNMNGGVCSLSGPKRQLSKEFGHLPDLPYHHTGTHNYGNTMYKLQLCMRCHILPQDFTAKFSYIILETTSLPGPNRNIA